ncbi:MAG: nucleoside diphosphate kinase regulator [bacterium]
MTPTLVSNPEPTHSIIVCADDLERLERLIAASGRRRDVGPLVALQDELDRAQVVDASELPDDVVAMHSRVHFVDEAGGAEETVTVVYPFEADAALGRVSVLAPVGSALLGLRVGQTIAWQVPNGGTRRLRVVAVG